MTYASKIKLLNKKRWAETAIMIWLQYCNNKISSTVLFLQVHTFSCAIILSLNPFTGDWKKSNSVVKITESNQAEILHISFITILRILYVATECP